MPPGKTKEIEVNMVLLKISKIVVWVAGSYAGNV